MYRSPAEYYSPMKKEGPWVTGSDGHGARGRGTGYSESERERESSYMSTYMWNLKGWRRTYLQGRDRDTDRERGHVTWAQHGKDGGQ